MQAIQNLANMHLSLANLNETHSRLYGDPRQNAADFSALIDSIVEQDGRLNEAQQKYR